MKKHIPNTITLLNAFSGCIACVCAFHGKLEWVCVWVLVSGIFDFFDGFCSRLLDAYSAIGKELDSLADLISFGMAPSIAIYSLLSRADIVYPALLEPTREYIPYLGFIIAIFSALRLAKFNIDERQTNSFIGLATPANAAFWVSFCAGIDKFTELNTVLIALTVLLIFGFSYLMNSEIPMFSLKKRELNWSRNVDLIALIVFLVIATSFFGLLGIAASILFYIAWGVISSKRTRTIEN